MTIRLHAFTFDTPTPERLAQFWADVLGRTVDPAQFPGFASIGMGAEDGSPIWLFQDKENVPAGSNRTHPDIATKNYDDELARILKLGATITEEHDVPGIRYVTLADPDGNNFDLADE